MEQNELQQRCERAVANKNSGKYNCAQAVACAFADVAGMDEAMAYRLTGAFGSGMGCLEGTCGALVGAGFILSAMSPDRVTAMRSMKRVMSEFGSKNGATLCKALKGVGTGVVLRECSGCVADSAALLGESIS